MLPSWAGSRHVIGQVASLQHPALATAADPSASALVHVYMPPIYIPPRFGNLNLSIKVAISSLAIMALATLVVLVSTAWFGAGVNGPFPAMWRNPWGRTRWDDQSGEALQEQWEHFRLVMDRFDRVSQSEASGFEDSSGSSFPVALLGPVLQLPTRVPHEVLVRATPADRRLDVVRFVNDARYLLLKDFLSARGFYNHTTSRVLLDAAKLANGEQDGTPAVCTRPLPPRSRRSFSDVPA